jgi:hypothetical protein
VLVVLVVLVVEVEVVVLVVVDVLLVVLVLVLVLVVGGIVEVVVVVVETGIVELVVVVPDAGATAPRPTAYTAATTTSTVSRAAVHHAHRLVPSRRLGTPQVCQRSLRSRRAFGRLATSD